MIKRLIKKIFKYLGYDLVRSDIAHIVHGQLGIRDILELYFFKPPADFFFIQVGANDGKEDDPMREFITHFNLKGILIEPQVGVFKKLKENYAGYNNVILENVALSREEGKRVLYLPSSNIHEKYAEQTKMNPTRIASFNKEQLKKDLAHNMPSFFKTHYVEDYIEGENVEAVSFATLVKKHNIQRIDLLQIDTEGYDFEIIKMIDFESFSPSFINYESKNLSEKDRIKCETFFIEKGYRAYKYGDICLFKLR